MGNGSLHIESVFQRKYLI